MQATMTQLPAMSLQGDAGPGKNHRILVVDDNQTIHEDFRKILGTDFTGTDFDAVEADIFGASNETIKRTQFEMDFASQGQEALERVQLAVEAGRRYAMVFMDVRMPPGWDGLETSMKIWNVDPDLQIVICTAYSDYSWDEMMNLIGNPERLLILKKPFDTIEVLQFAHALTEKWSLLQASRSNTRSLECTVSERTAEYKAAAERVREQAMLIEKARDAIIVRDLDDTIQFWNHGAECLYGWTAAEALGQKIFQLLFDEEKEKDARAASTELFEKGNWIGELLQKTKDGRVANVECRWTLMHDDDGKPKSIFAIHTDITEKKQMEVQLRRAQKLESIGQLAAGIAHEINTPTQYIGEHMRFVQQSFAGVNELLKTHAKILTAAKEKGWEPELVSETETAAAKADMKFLGEEIPKAIHESLQGVERIRKIAGAMKDFSHPGSEGKTLVDLNRAIESTVTIARNEWKYVADIVANLDASLPPVPCLPGEFNQVILNLLVNASHAISDVVGDASGGKGTITISTQRRDDWVEIRIQDTGKGIPDSIREKVFEPFFTTKPVGRGTGQGLMIARSVIVEKHQGEISFESNPDKGTTFLLRLPMNPQKLEG